VAHPGIGDRIEVDDLLLDQNIGRPIEVPGWEGALFRIAAMFGGRGDAGMKQSGKPSIFVAPRAIRCSAIVRPPIARYTPSRDKDSFTGRFNARAGRSPEPRQAQF